MTNQCPKCGGGPLRKAAGPGALGGLLFSMAGCFLFIPVIGWVLVPVLLVLSLLLFISAPFSWGLVTVRCGRCRKAFMLSKREFHAGGEGAP